MDNTSFKRAALALSLAMCVGSASASIIWIGDGPHEPDPMNSPYTVRDGDIAIGDGAIADGFDDASQRGSTCVGKDAHCSNGGSGLGAGAKTDGGVAVGKNANAGRGVSIGANTNSGGSASQTAVGNGSANLNGGLLAINGTTNGSGSVAVQGTVIGPNSTAVNGRVDGRYAVTVGGTARDFGVAVGVGTYTGTIDGFTNPQSRYATAVGYQCQARADNSVCLGSYSTTTRPNTVSVGSSVTRNGGTENLAGTVGPFNRQIVNVAAGTQDTDAVNLKQLNDAIAGISTGADPLAMRYDDSTKGTATLEGTNGTQLKNVADGTEETDAVNRRQLDAVDTRVTTVDSRLTDTRYSLQQQANWFGGGASYDPVTGVMTGPTFAFESGGTYTNVADALYYLDRRITDSVGGTGSQGPAGDSAYQVAVNNGYVGTETEWLASLKGDKGDKGDRGDVGPQGPAGRDGRDGVDGQDGATGPQGPQGPAGQDGRDGRDGVDGQDGATGPQGPAGQDGRDGQDGAPGPQGPEGPAGPQGPEGTGGNTPPEPVPDCTAHGVCYDDETRTSVRLGGSSAQRPVAVTNVANGRIAQGSTEAVNGGQIWALEQDFNDRWTQVNTRLSGMEERIDAVGAQSAAMAMMNGAGQYLPVGKVAVTAGWGQYGNKAAFAVGLKVRSSEKSSWSMGLSVAPDGKAMGGVGFSMVLP